MANPQSDPEQRSAQRPVDAIALARVLRRLNRAAEAPWLHAEVARRMGERLSLIRMKPARVLDWGAFLGASQSVLAQAYPQARIDAVEADPERRERTAAARAAAPAPWWSARRWAVARPTVLLESEVGAGQADLVWANMTLHGVADPQALMRQWQRALTVDGFLMFSTLGPGTLAQLRVLYAEQDWPAAHAPFVDMHDLGDMLIEAGFADPVMDQEQIQLSWPTADALLAELRQLGGNIALADEGRGARASGLRTPRWRRRLEGALAATADSSGRITLGFELVYGHAVKPAPRPRLAAETRVPLDDLRAMVRAGRRAR